MSAAHPAPASARRAAAGLTALALVAPLALPQDAGAAARTANLPGWAGMTAAISGRTVLITTAAPVRTDPRAGGERPPAGARPFVYYRAEMASLRLDARRRLIAPVGETLVSLRTSIGAMTAGRLVPSEDGRVLMVPGARAFVPPVVLCCDAEGTETVIYSESRTDAPVPLAAALDGAVVRMVLRRPDGSLALAEADPAGPPLTRTETPLPGSSAPGLAAMAAGVVAWAEPAAPSVSIATPASGGPLAPRAVPLPGPAVEVLAARDLVAVTVRAGGGHAVIRIDGATSMGTVVWAGARRPRVAVGGGTVALADGRRLFAGRAGRARPVRRAPGTVAALAVDGDRLVSLARVRRGGERRTVVRIEELR